MNSLSQYIDLYRSHHELLDAYGATPLNALRGEAAEMLEHIRLPRRGDENFANIDLGELLAPDFGINLTAPSLRVGGQVKLPEGVEVGSLREFARKNPEWVSRYYGRLADLANPITALDTLLAQDGLCLHVHAGVKLSRPLQLANLLDCEKPQMAARRVLVIVEENAEARLLVCDRASRRGVQFLALDTFEAFVGEGARFDYYQVEETNESCTRLSTLYVEQSRDSQVNIDSITLTNGRTRNEYYCRFAGENAGLRLYGMGTLDGDRVLATYSHIEHAVPRCKSDELFKYIADQNSSGAFTGRILVAPGAVKTEAYQANRNLVGSQSAKMYSRPQLEIYNDDVKCSHGCATGQIDPLQLFYLRTRGIPEAEAKRLLRQAFMSDVLAAIDNDAVRTRLQCLLNPTN